MLSVRAVEHATDNLASAIALKAIQALHANGRTAPTTAMGMVCVFLSKRLQSKL